MQPIGSSGGLDYRHCPCGDTWSWPTPIVVPSRGAGEIFAALLPRRLLSSWQWGVSVHPLTLDVYPVTVSRGLVAPLVDN